MKEPTLTSKDLSGLVECSRFKVLGLAVLL
jgi:hypothetical protein